MDSDIEMELESDNDGEFDDDYDYYNTGKFWEGCGGQKENRVQGRFVQFIDYTHAIDLKHTNTIRAF